jgi:hypothetical protein
LFKTILVTMKYNLYRLLLQIYLYILIKMFVMSILVVYHTCTYIVDRKIQSSWEVWETTGGYIPRPLILLKCKKSIIIRITIKILLRLALLPHFEVSPLSCITYLRWRGVGFKWLLRLLTIVVFKNVLYGLNSYFKSTKRWVNKRYN